MSTIEWTDETWNPVRGCDKISPGCKNCYAETFAERFRGTPKHPYEQGFDPRLVYEALDIPRTWRKQRKVFVCSMSDLFGSFVPAEYIRQVFDTMRSCPQHTFQVLTKRADRMAAILLYWTRNVWAGVSVEDREYGLPRIDHLRRTPAYIRFLSVEPLLEDLGRLDLAGIDWVIVGGESGTGARPCRMEWVRSIVEQCAEQRVACFVKQLGRHPVEYRGLRRRLVGLGTKGQDFDAWPEWAKVRQFPTVT